MYLDTKVIQGRGSTTLPYEVLRQSAIYQTLHRAAIPVNVNTRCQDTLHIDHCILSHDSTISISFHFISGFKTLKQYNIQAEARSDKISKEKTNKTDKQYKH